MTTSSHAEQVAKRLSPTAKRGGKGWVTCCPAHDDRNPSLCITDGYDGALLVHCHRGCSQADVIGALAQLDIGVNPRHRHRAGERTVTYPYQAETGQLLYENVRVESLGGRKTFRQRRPDGKGGHVYSLDDVRRVPYRLPNILANGGAPLHACEGEKDANRLASMGLVSTSVATPERTDLSAFKGRIVYIHEDNDAAGRDKSAKLAKALQGIAARITVVQYLDAGPAGDVSDWLNQGNNLDQLLARCRGAPEWSLRAEGPTQRPMIKLQGGNLAEATRAAEQHLMSAGVPFYQRDRMLVRPVTLEEAVAGGAKTTTTGLKQVDESYLRYCLCEHIQWQRYSRREKEWVQVDPPLDVVKLILGRSGEWPFKNISGIISTPTLRPDGTLLCQPGHDEQTGLLLVDPPALPSSIDKPTREDAIAALEVLDEVLEEFPFYNEESWSVARSAILTTVMRGAFPVVPLHVASAPAAGTGKSYLFDVVTTIGMGCPCPVIAAGPSEAELEKRLGAVVLSGLPVFSVDNVNGEFGGDFLCQLLERPIIHPRILGMSKNVRLRNVFTIFATGNNLQLLGDMTRRSLVCELDARLE